MLEAAAASRSGARLVVAGRGSLEDELRDQARALGIADRVQFLGFVGDDELVDWFAGARGVIYTPHDEDYGYVTLQAFLAGKPVVTVKDSGGVLEWVDDGVTGAVTDGSADTLAEAVDRLAADASLAERLGTAGRAECGFVAHVCSSEFSFAGSIRRPRTVGGESYWQGANSGGFYTL